MAYTTINGTIVRKCKWVKWVGLHIEVAKPGNHPEKGIKNGRCNVTACQKTGAIYYNKSTRKYYCKVCADEINWPGGRADCMALYGTPLLCELDG